MEGNFQHEALKKCVAVICQSIGFQGIYSMPLEVLTDLLHRYLREIAVLTHRFAEHDNRTLPTLVDLSYTFNELKISLPELEEFVSSVESVPFPDAIPKLPVMRPSQLNLLKPGSREILSRPIHIHEHLPPMLPDKEEEDSKDDLLNGAGAGDNSAPGNTDCANATEDQDGGDQSSLRHQGGGSPSHFSSLLAAAASKRSSDSEASAAKRFNGVDGEGEPVREIDSVIMTTSGFISSAREGKLPDARLPDIPLPTLPHTTSSRAAGGGGRGGSSAANGSHSAQTSATIKKKMSLERLMRHKHNIALKKKASTGTPFSSGIPTGASQSHSSKSKSAKKSLSHSAVMSMAAGAAVDSNLCFTTKHGKSKDKLKPKIPATPPGTSRLPNPAAMSAENQQHFINSTCNISKRPNPLLTTPIGSLPPPKLKIPTPKMKQPEFSTDVLPLPKEDIQEQQERKLQIMKKEEKQKELARAAKNGMLSSFVGTENVDGNGVVSGAAGVGGRVVPTGTRVVPTGGLPGPPLARGGQPPECGGVPQALLSKIKKEKKEKEGKKELKKINKDDKKDKEKRDKEKRELKKEKILKKKEEKEKRDKDKKDEKKREKEAKKMKEASKKDKDSKKPREGKKIKDGKVKEKDPMKKEKKELKKVKKVSPGSATTPKSSHPKEPSNLSLGGVEQSQSILSNISDSFLTRTPLSVAPLDTLTNPSMSTTTNTSEAMASPLSPDLGKSKLCIFKKNNKNPKEVLPHDFLEKKSESSGSLAFDSKSLLQGSVTSHSFVGGMDMSADLSGVISSPSIVETPKSSMDKAAKPRKRKKPDSLPGAKGVEASGSPKAKKPKKEKGIGVNSKSRPKGAAKGVPNLSIGTTKNPVELMDDNATPFATLGMMSGTPMSHWDSRPLTPGGHDTSPGIPNCPPTPGMHSLPPFGHVPLPPHASPFSPPNMCMDAFVGGPHGSDILERPLTPGGQFLHGRGVPPDLSFSNSPVTPTQGLGGGFSLPLSPGISDQSPVTPVITSAGAAPPSSLSAAPVVGGGHSTPSLSASDTDKKKKEKEHRREKKDKDKIKKKKDKKDKGGKVEKKLKDKQKKEKKKKKGLVVAGASTAVEGRGEGPVIAPPTSESAPITEQQATPLPATPKIAAAGGEAGQDDDAGRRSSTRVRKACYKYR